MVVTDAVSVGVPEEEAVITMERVRISPGATSPSAHVIVTGATSHPAGADVRVTSAGSVNVTVTELAIDPPSFPTDASSANDRPTSTGSAESLRVTDASAPAGDDASRTVRDRAPAVGVPMASDAATTNSASVRGMRAMLTGRPVRSVDHGAPMQDTSGPSGYHAPFAMRRPRSILIAALVVTLLVATGGQAAAGTRSDRFRQKLYGFVNDYRVKNGRPALKDDSVLDSFAWKHSVKMAQARTLFHSTTLEAKVRTRGGTTWGENIGVGPSMFSVFRAWVASSPHRANMLNGRFRFAGVGVVLARGSYWITLDLYGR